MPRPLSVNSTPLEDQSFNGLGKREDCMLIQVELKEGTENSWPPPSTLPKPTDWLAILRLLANTLRKSEVKVPRTGSGCEQHEMSPTLVLAQLEPPTVGADFDFVSGAASWTCHDCSPAASEALRNDCLLHVTSDGTAFGGARGL
jgi:hypothetical protein